MRIASTGSRSAARRAGYSPKTSPTVVERMIPSKTTQGPPELRRHERCEQWLPVTGTIADKLATYFGIDPKELEAEKQAMLRAVRRLHDVET